MHANSIRNNSVVYVTFTPYITSSTVKEWLASCSAGQQRAPLLTRQCGKPDLSKIWDNIKSSVPGLTIQQGIARLVGRRR